MRPSWSPRSVRSRCTAGSARSSPASRSIRPCSRRTSRRSGSGASNLAAHIGIVRRYGIPAVVAINAFPTDTPAEIEAIRDVAHRGRRPSDAVLATHFVDGGDGRDRPGRGGLGRDRGSVARLRAALSGRGAARREDPHDRHGDLRRDRDRADRRRPRSQLKQYERLGFGHLPVCMAKTQYSISHDASLKGRPSGFTVPIREIRLSAGAGFITPICGEMRTMPGLPSQAGRREHRHRRRRERRRPVLTLGQPSPPPTDEDQPDDRRRSTIAPTSPTRRSDSAAGPTDAIAPMGSGCRRRPGVGGGSGADRRHAADTYSTARPASPGRRRCPDRSGRRAGEHSPDTELLSTSRPVGHEQVSPCDRQVAATSRTTAPSPGGRCGVERRPGFDWPPGTSG